VTDPELRAKLEALSKEQVCQELKLGLHALEEILAALLEPRHDPRNSLPRPLLKRGELRLEELHPGKELRGTVVNVVDFGAFVDIGLRESALVHISQMANRFVRNPHEIVSVGDAVSVWVLSVDGEKKRVSLTLIPPGTPRGPDARQKAGGERSVAGDARPRRHRRPHRRETTPTPARAMPAAAPEPSAEPSAAPQAGATAESAPPADARPQPRPPGKPRDLRPRRPLPQLSREALEGQVPLRTFAELMAYYLQAKRPQ
jgi:uncharacterized protein